MNKYKNAQQETMEVTPAEQTPKKAIYYSGNIINAQALKQKWIPVVLGASILFLATFGMASAFESAEDKIYALEADLRESVEKISEYNSLLTTEEANRSTIEEELTQAKWDNLARKKYETLTQADKDELKRLEQKLGK